MSIKILAGNWKLNKTRAETQEFFRALGRQVATSPIKKIVATSPTLLETDRELQSTHRTWRGKIPVPSPAKFRPCN